MFVSETYDIQDCLLYKSSIDNTFSKGTVTIGSNNRTNNDLLNTPLSLPSHFEVKATIKRTSSSNGQSSILLGETTSNAYDVGMLRSNGSISIRENSLDSLILDKNTGVVPTNTDVELTYTYDNGDHTISANGTSGTVTSTQYSMDKFFGVYTNTNGRLSNLKIKPL